MDPVADPVMLTERECLMREERLPWRGCSNYAVFSRNYFRIRAFRGEMDRYTNPKGKREIDGENARNPRNMEGR